MLAMPDTPLALAAICTVPVSTDVTVPLLDTVATFALDVFQKIVAPGTVCPCALTTFAVSETLAPMTIESLFGVMMTLPTPLPVPVLSLPHERSREPATAAKANTIERCTARIRTGGFGGGATDVNGLAASLGST